MREQALPDDIIAAAARVLELCRQRNRMVATVESCTGGLIAAALTEVPGSSDVMAGGLVTYANSAKMGLVGVQERTLASFGAVSAETAREMALGGLHRLADAHLCVSVTGVAGPGGGTAQKPVGLVFMALARRDGADAPSPGGPAATAMAPIVHVEHHLFAPDHLRGDVIRTTVRLATVRRALALLAEGAVAH